MTQIPMRDGLILAGILFSLGLISLLVRRNLIFVLMSLEVMLNAAGLAFVVRGVAMAPADGQVVFLFILADGGGRSGGGTGTGVADLSPLRLIGCGSTRRDERITCSAYYG